MHNISRVHIIQTPQNLIHEVLIVISLQSLSGIDQLVQVSFHQLGDNVYVVIVGRFGWSLDVY